MIINYPIYSNSTVREYLESFYLSKSKIYTLFLEKRILLNNHNCKENDLIKANDVISLILDEEIDYKRSNKEIDIIYEDDYFLIINKPKGIIIHDTKENNDSLCNRVADYYYNNGITLNVRFAHRLDFNTTGLIVFCKDILSLSYMNHFIETHDISRVYRLFVWGKLKDDKGEINLPIGEDRHSKNKMRVSKTGKKAITLYKVLKKNNKYSYLEVKLKTGRTHQIRVHFSYLNHPLLGDDLYGIDDGYDRCLLHSYKIEFIHPVYKEKLEICAPIPNDMKGLE